MDRLSAIFALSLFFLVPAAHAYVGPGAGLSLLGALWALLAAVATAVVFVIAWPIRRMRRRKREAQKKEREDREQDDRSPPPDESRTDGPARAREGEAGSLRQP